MPRRSRCIGDILAALIVIGVAVVVSITAALIITNTVRISEPRGAIVTIQGVRAIPLRPDYSRIVVEVVASVQGTSAVRYSGMTVYDPNGNAMSACQFDSPGTDAVFSPGQTFTITATCSSSGGQWAHRQIVAEVQYRDVSTNIEQRARATGTIMPYT